MWLIIVAERTSVITTIAAVHKLKGVPITLITKTVTGRNVGDMTTGFTPEGTQSKQCVGKLKGLHLWFLTEFTRFTAFRIKMMVQVHTITILSYG